MKILITGGNGQLGTDCNEVLRRAHEVVSVDIENVNIAFYNDVNQLIQNIGPDVVLNCAAYTRVDDCETEKEQARSVNVRGVENLAYSAQEHGCHLVHISTDYVFDGLKKPPEPYVEEDLPNPLSYYGVTKYEGEKKIVLLSGRHTIIRTAWLYGLNGHNFIKTMLKLALRAPNRAIKVVADQYGSPTWSYRLALQIEQLIQSGGPGIYHATAEEYCSWYELARYFFEQMEIPQTILPCASESYPTPARRPKNSILENKRLKKEHINIMVPWQDDLKQFVSEHKQRLINECRP